MAIDDRKNKMADRWDALVAQGVPEDKATEQVNQEFQDPKDHPVGNAVRTFVGSMPLGVGERMMALGRMFDEKIPYGEALNRQKASVEKFSGENPRTALGLAIGANVPLFRLLPNAATRKAAAAIGAGVAGSNRLAATGDEPVGERLWETTKDAAFGGGASWVAPWLLSSPFGRAATGAAVGGFLAPEGARATTVGAGVGAAAATNPSFTAKMVADATGRLVPRIANTARAISEATGIRGDVNAELSGIDKVAKFLGGMVGQKGGTGEAQIKSALRFEGRAKELYDKMRGAVARDDRMQGYLNDPDFVKAANATMREMGLPEGTSPLRPDVLHKMKQIIRRTVERKYAADAPLDHITAARLQPKIQSFTKDFHAAYPEAATADRFWQKGMVVREGSGMGYAAARGGAQNPSPSVVGESDVAAVNQFVASQPDDELKRIAAAAARRGARGQVREQVAAMPLDKGRTGLLQVPSLRTSPAAAEQRGLAAGNKADDFERLLEDVDVANVRAAPESFVGPWEAHAVKQALDPNVNPMTKDEARKIVRTVLRDPKAYQQTLEAYRKGMGILDFWKTQVAGQTGAAVGR